MKKFVRYISPLAQIGKRKYSTIFPLLVSLAVVIFSEVYSHVILGDPNAVASYIIIINIITLIYFASRDGLRGGLITFLITIGYYVYIIYSRQMEGDNRSDSLLITGVLGAIYLVIVLVIGWLKQTIDKLVDREANEKRRLQAIIQQLPVGVVITDEKGTITQVNKQLYTILGKEVKNHWIGDLYFPNTTYKDKPVTSNQWPLIQSLNTGKSIVGKEFVMTRRNGKQITLQISSAAIKNSEDKIVAAASIINDITLQKEAEKQKDEFISIASHELKTPVTSIKAYTQVLKHTFKKSGDMKSAESLNKMDGQLNKLNDLIGDLLDVTKMETGHLKFNKAEYDFDSVMREQIETLQLTTQKHNIILKCNTNKRIFGDKERIGQVVTNLLSNAIKYSPHAKKIMVTGKVVGKNVQLSVQDFGIGMPKKNKDKVFERFYRISGPNSKTFPGLGLGLYISHEIVKRMGGKLWVESEVGKGSIFYFSLPIHEKK